MTDIGARAIGARVLRAEDPRILTGRGRYIDDIVLPGMLHAAFKRSTVPHGRLVSVDASAARAMPGVIAVYTGDDLARLTNATAPGASIGINLMPGLKAPAAMTKRFTVMGKEFDPAKPDAYLASFAIKRTV